MSGIAASCIVVVITVISVYKSPVSAQLEGERCVLNDSRIEGKCVIIEKCPYAMELVKSKKNPQTCGVVEHRPVVCCPHNAKEPKVAAGQNGTNIGDKSFKNCKRYITPKFFEYRGNNFVSGGNKSLGMEFPHMALLGYGNRSDIQWLCGGSLISEEFVLTAAHCTHSPEFGSLQIVRLGELDLNSTIEQASPEDFNVSEVIVHPSYISSTHYHDIALIRLDHKVQFNDFKKPACLFRNKDTPIDRPLTATGWGKVDYVGKTSNHLMSVNLQFINNGRCVQRYKSSLRKLPDGIEESTQICAGDPSGIKDTCSGDSGGPLQVELVSPYFHKEIVGITSFGKHCGIENTVGVYTKVSHYVDWIENIVWKEDALKEAEAAKDEFVPPFTLHFRVG